MPNLILAIGAGYSPTVFERFLASIRATGSSCDVIIAVPNSEISNEKKEICSRYSGILASYPSSDCLPACLRFKIFSTILNSLDENYNNSWVLHVDFRDVIFQSDPFSVHLPPGPELFFALEDGLIRESSFNCEWLLSGFGEEVLNSLANRTISCAGSTLGTYRAMLHYMNKMSEYIFDDNEQNKPLTVKRNDQGVHNYLLYTQELAPYFPMGMGNETGLFLTLGLMREIQIEPSGLILDSSGNLPAVLHQIDRLPSHTLVQLAEKMPWPMLDLIEVSVTKEVMQKLAKDGDTAFS